MRNAEADGLGNLRMTQQHFVDLSRPDLLTAAIDQLLDAAGQREVAVGVQEPLVAGAEPSVGEGFRVGVRIVLIAADHVRTLNDHFSALARREQIPRVVHDADLDARSGPHRARLSLRRRPWIGRHLVRGFRHAVGFEHRYAEHALHLAHHFRRERRAAGADESQAIGPGRPFVSGA